jgi:hypothetical protein
MIKIPLYYKNSIIKYSLVDYTVSLEINKYRWHLSESGYAVRYTSKNKRVFLHRLIFNAKPHERIDHINRDKLDNRKENLRLATHSQNMLNRDLGLSIGVHKIYDKWEARGGYMGKLKYFGLYETKLAAEIARDLNMVKLHGPDFVKLNHPEFLEAYL